MSQAGGPSGEVGRINVAFTGDASGAIAAAKATKDAMDATAASAEVATQKVQELGGKGRTFTPGKDGAYRLADDHGPYQIIGANEAVAQSAEKAGQATKKAGEAADSYGKTLRDQVAPTRDFIAGVRQQVGVLTSVVSTFAAVTGALGLAAAAGYQLGRSLFQTGDSAGRLSDLMARANKQIEVFNTLRQESLDQKFGEAVEGTGIAYVAQQIQDERANLKKAQEELDAFEESGAKVFGAAVATGIASTGLPVPFGLDRLVTDRADARFKLSEAQSRIDDLSRQFEGMRQRDTGMVSEQKRTNIKLDRSVQRYIGFSY